MVSVGKNDGGYDQGIEVPLTYIRYEDRFVHEKPYMYLGRGHNDVPRRNFDFTSGISTRLEDVRALGRQLSFEKDGFVIVPYPSTFQPTLDEIGKLHNHSTDLVHYINSVRKFSRDYFEAHEVLCFDWRIRRAGANDQIEHGLDDRNLPGLRTEPTMPAYAAHADLSTDGGWLTLRAYLSEAELANVTSKQWRIRIVDCWRPLVDNVQDVPLALCQRGTIEHSDWIPYDRVDGTHAPGEGMFLKPSPLQKWRWISNQTRNEMTIFECWDSEADGRDAQIGHAAFQLPDVHEHQRVSIELRLMVIFKSDV